MATAGLLLSTVIMNSGELRIQCSVQFSVHEKFMVCFCHRLQYKTIALYQPQISNHTNRNGIRSSPEFTVAKWGGGGGGGGNRLPV